MLDDDTGLPKDVLTSPVDLTRSDTLSAEVRVSVRAVLLAPIEVVANRQLIAPGLIQLQERMDFYKKLGLGRFATRKEIE